MRGRKTAGVVAAIVFIVCRCLALSGDGAAVCYPYCAAITEEPVIRLSEKVAAAWALIRYAGTDEFFLRAGWKQEREAYAAALRQWETAREEAPADDSGKHGEQYRAMMIAMRFHIHTETFGARFSPLVDREKDDWGMSANAAFLLKEVYREIGSHFFPRVMDVSSRRKTPRTVTWNSIGDIVDELFVLAGHDGQEWQRRRWTSKAIFILELDRLQWYGVEVLEKRIAALERTRDQWKRPKNSLAWLERYRSSLADKMDHWCGDGELAEVAEFLVAASRCLR